VSHNIKPIQLLQHCKCKIFHVCFVDYLIFKNLVELKLIDKTN